MHKLKTWAAEGVSVNTLVFLIQGAKTGEFGVGQEVGNAPAGSLCVIDMGPSRI